MTDDRGGRTLIVSRTVRFDAPEGVSLKESLRARESVSITLEDGQTVRLDPARPNAAVFADALETLARLGRPIALEIDPATDTIDEVRMPEVGRVMSIRPSDEGFDVELQPSHAIHRLDRESAQFAELEAQLRKAADEGAAVILTEDSAHKILDIRFFSPAPAGADLLPGTVTVERSVGLGEWLWRFWCWPWWPWWWFWTRGCLSFAQAQQVFDEMASKSCNPSAVAAPCIPFMYPDDGCWGRAHEMCRLMIAKGLKPKKVWIQRSPSGGLRVDTKNNPNCEVRWGWHVAPTLCVRQGCLVLPWTQRMVIDPSMFTTPVTQATWKAAQNDPAATLTPSEASVFYLWTSPSDPYYTDAAYTKTNQVLATYRTALQLRSASVGPPPYAHCP